MEGRRAGASVQTSVRDLFTALLLCLSLNALAAKTETIAAYSSSSCHDWPRTCPGILPRMKQTWQMNLSTIIQPCNDSGPFDPAFGSKFGVADYDWSNMKQLWVNAKPMDCEKLLVTQAELNRKLNPKSRAFVYRNLVKALNW